MRPEIGIAFAVSDAGNNGREELPALVERGLEAYLGLTRMVRFAGRVDRQRAQSCDFVVHIGFDVVGAECRIGYRLENPRSAQQILIGSVSVPRDFVASILSDEVDRIGCPLVHALLRHCAAMTDQEAAGFKLWCMGESLLQAPDRDDRAAARSLLEQAQALESGSALPLASLARLELEALADGDSIPAMERMAAAGLEFAEAALHVDAAYPLALALAGRAHLYRHEGAAASTCFARLAPLAFRLPDIAVVAAEHAAVAAAEDAEACVRRAAAALRLHPSPPDWWRQCMTVAYAMTGEPGQALGQSRLVATPSRAALAWQALLCDELGQASDARQAVASWRASGSESAGFEPAAAAIAAAAWLDRALPVQEPHRRWLKERFAALVATMAA